MTKYAAFLLRYIFSRLGGRARGAAVATLLTLLTVPVVWSAGSNLQISGTLVTEPCSLDVNNNTLAVDFGTVIKKSLYKDVRTPGIPLTITLTDCDVSLGKTVNLTFSGSESRALPGYLAATGDGSTGIAIGIETQKGTGLPKNTPSAEFGLQEGTTRIMLQAYIEAEPEAIMNAALVAGGFTATATINAEYP